MARPRGPMGPFCIELYRAVLLHELRFDGDFESAIVLGQEELERLKATSLVISEHPGRRMVYHLRAGPFG